MTKLDRLLRAREIGLEHGLNYIYIGNVGHPDFENTMCPDCGHLCIKRVGWSVIGIGITKNGHCRNCGKSLNLKQFVDNSI